MKPVAVAARVLVILFFGWLYGGDVARWFQAQGAEVAALAELPRLWLGLLGCAVAVGGAVLLVMGRSQPPSWKPNRLFTIAALGLVFLDFVVLNSRRTPLSADEQSVLAVQYVADSASRESAPQAVLRDPSMLLSFLEQLGPVPYFVKGERVGSWKLDLRERCTGPAADAGNAEVGTLIYCVSSDRQQAWITLVGTPLGQLFGPRAVVSTKEGWVGEVQVPPAEPEATEQDLDQPVWDEPTQPGE